MSEMMPGTTRPWTPDDCRIEGLGRIQRKEEGQCP